MGVGRGTRCPAGWQSCPCCPQLSLTSLSHPPALYWKPQLAATFDPNARPASRCGGQQGRALCCWCATVHAVLQPHAWAHRCCPPTCGGVPAGLQVQDVDLGRGRRGATRAQLMSWHLPPQPGAAAPAALGLHAAADAASSPPLCLQHVPRLGIADVDGPRHQVHAVAPAVGAARRHRHLAVGAPRIQLLDRGVAGAHAGPVVARAAG